MSRKISPEEYIKYGMWINKTYEDAGDQEMTLQDTIKGLKEIEYAWEMAESEQNICLKDTYMRSIYSAIKYLENEDALISRVSDSLKNSISIDHALEIIYNKRAPVEDTDAVSNDEYMHSMTWNDAVDDVFVAFLDLKEDGK